MHHGSHGHGRHYGGWSYHPPSLGNIIGGAIAGGIALLTIDAITQRSLESNKRYYESEEKREMPLCTAIPPEKHVMVKDKNGKDAWECASTTDNHQICFYWDASRERKLSCYIP